MMSDLFSRLHNHPSTLEESILDHIVALLNSRQGSLKHLPDYGLPEFESHRGFLHAKKTFMNELKKLLEQYEPRLHVLKMDEKESTRSDCVVMVQLLANVKNIEAVHLDAMLLRDGEILIGKSL